MQASRGGGQQKGWRHIGVGAAQTGLELQLIEEEQQGTRGVRGIRQGKGVARV